MIPSFTSNLILYLIEWKSVVGANNSEWRHTKAMVIPLFFLAYRSVPGTRRTTNTVLFACQFDVSFVENQSRNPFVEELVLPFSFDCFDLTIRGLTTATSRDRESEQM